MPKDPRIKKVLVIGSGPIIIGQAAEFDYSGTQACRALKAEGIETVLLNSNPATIMTDPDVADHVYIEPMTLEVVERILDIEKPDSVLPNLGGQMGLNLSMELARSGYLDRTGIRLLACKPETIDRAEDRELFKETMEKLHQPIIPSEVVETLQDALACADRIGYPVIVRPAFTMGGTGGGICETREKLIEIGTNGLRLSPIHQILVEKCIAGWKEIEYEVMRDHKGNVITVCNMENLDPVGIHTGDSVVVAPSQTLTDHEYQMLRTAALDIITELGIEGGCNCQFALKPDSYDYAVIEVNPRVSRSSALASKATGYPIAKVATKIAIGYTLDEITNDVTGKTCACFEPALDYIVVKYPKWPFDKFVYADKSLGTQMMATGEVDVADHVYIEPMTLEVVERILDIEKPDSVLPNLGGQMGLNLSMELARSGYLDRTGIRLLACKPETIDRAEDRELFKETMEKLHQPIIPSEVVETLQDALACADRIGYPVIVRPAFTMGGTGGGICETREKLIEIGTNGLRLSPIHQILVEKCIAGWKEIEYEVMRDHKGNVITVCNMENLDLWASTPATRWSWLPPKP